MISILVIFDSLFENIGDLNKNKIKMLTNTFVIQNRWHYGDTIKNDKKPWGDIVKYLKRAEKSKHWFHKSTKMKLNPESRLIYIIREIFWDIFLTTHLIRKKKFCQILNILPSTMIFFS